MRGLLLRLGGFAHFRMRSWLAIFLATFAIQGALWLIPHRGWDSRVARWDPHYIYLPMLMAALQLNLYRPLVAHVALMSVRLLADGIERFRVGCAEGLLPNRPRIDELVRRSLMLVTALVPHIGYDRAAEIAKKAHREGSTLREAALALGYVSAQDFDRWVRPEAMIGPA